MKTTYDIVVDVICEIGCVDEADVKSVDTFEEMNLDSLDMVEIMLELEEYFDLDINDETFASCKTVDDVARLIDKLRA